MAMIVNGELVDWYVKAFKGVWSEQKKELILDTIDRMLDRYSIEAFAIKVPNAIHRHAEVQELHRDINFLAQQKKIKTETLSIKSLKRVFTEARNKKNLGKIAVGLYPELQEEFTKEAANRNPYYTKLFEAVLSAHILSHDIPLN